jgi:16S rRNA (adenine1518-N6/adenine1519-N6)-dimethyltransferase
MAAAVIAPDPDQRLRWRLVQTLNEIKSLLADRGLRPKHRLGQNFLHDKNQLIKLIDAAHLRAGDLALEIGPGTGTLTEALLERGVEVIACEIDADLAALLRERLGANPMFALIEGDALEKQRTLSSALRQAIGDRSFKLVANLPYQIASPLMSALLIDHPPAQGAGGGGCAGQFVTIQKEVADRLLAGPSSKEYGPLSIIVQAFAEVKRIATLSPSCFWPPPEVTSAMVAIAPFSIGGGDDGRPRTPDDRRAFARFVVDLFTKRRKQLGTILGRDFSQWPRGVTASLRPEALAVDQLVALWRAADAGPTRDS